MAFGPRDGTSRVLDVDAILAIANAIFATAGKRLRRTPTAVPALAETTPMGIFR